MIVLDTVNKKLEVTTTAAVSVDFEVSYADITTTTFVAGESNGNIVTATTIDIVTAPAASTQRQVKYIGLRNRGTATQSVTNSDGTAGRTATIASFPATAVIGTVVWFQLAAGDRGVRSIQTVTLGTSYAAGAVSLIAARLLSSVAGLIANVGGVAPLDRNTGVRLYNGTCAQLIGLMSATTATTITGSAVIAVR